ncbi:MAG TPA: hypothetical protein VIK45_10940, partial [Candidatus Dormibacteraeota bacterium]
PGLLTGLSVSGPPAPDEGTRSEQARQVAGRMRAARADAAMLELNLATPAMLSCLREHRAGVFVWTAKDTDTCASLSGLAPDGIMSDALDDHLSLLS